MRVTKVTKTKSAKTQTREEWLHAVAENVRPVFKKAGYPLAKDFRIGVGWPSSRALSGGKARVLGECWQPEAADDKKANLVVSLYLYESVQVAGTVIHELAHTVTKGEGHKGKFVDCIRKIGLLGKPTEAAEPDPVLLERLNGLFKTIGQYPHARVDGVRRNKQGTRMIKLTCPGCGYVVRTSQKWIDMGVPECGICQCTFS